MEIEPEELGNLTMLALALVIVAVGTAAFRGAAGAR